MRVLAAGSLISLLTLTTMPAHAQSHGGAPEGQLTGPEEIAKKQREDAAEVEKAYKNTLKNTSSTTAASKPDPWGTVRPSDPQAKPSSQSKNSK